MVNLQNPDAKCTKALLAQLTFGMRNVVGIDKRAIASFKQNVKE